MTSLKQIIISIFFLLSVGFTNAQKKNDVILQMGILNYFYDEHPSLMNTSYINSGQYTFGGFMNSIFIKSIGIKYARMLNSKSNISGEFGYFNGFYPRRSTPPLENGPVIDTRRWYIYEVSYNRLFISRSKFKLFYGGGLVYRHGFEAYHVLAHEVCCGGGGTMYESVFEFTGKRDLGLSLNLNLKCNIWSGLFFYSKIDAQFFLFDFAKNEYQEMTELYSTHNFPKTFPINHTLTIGLGYEF